MSLFGVSVLLIEDEPAVAGLIAEGLRDGQPPFWAVNYTVKVVPTLQKARKYISGGGWDVILLDLGLPDSEGMATFEACYAIARAPILVLTGSADLAMLRQMLQAGACRCFNKTDVMSSMRWLNYAVMACVESYRQRSTIVQMQDSLIGDLRNLITACVICHKWRDPSSGKFILPEQFLEKHQVFLTHGICGDCAQARYGDVEAQLSDMPAWLAKNLQSSSTPELIETMRQVAHSQDGLKTLEALRQGLSQAEADIADGMG